MKSRKRRPGGGRKPQGNIRGKVETFSTRITHETRQLLEKESVKTGHSISQVAEHLLRMGLQTKRDREIDAPMRALRFLIDQLAIGISQYERGEPSINWRNNPFLFRALQLAISGLMDHLSPPGDLSPPQFARVVGPITTPEERAAWAVNSVLFTLVAATRPFDIAAAAADLPAPIRSTLELLTYQYQDAARDLQLQGGAS